jgi:hypothetical protein
MGLSLTPLPRIASLVPSLTELLAQLGLAPHLVARTGYCIHPGDVLQAVPRVGGTKSVNIEKLRRLAPTHVLVNIDENTVETVRFIKAWQDIPVPEIIVTHPCTPQDNLALVDQVARAFALVPGVTERAAALTASMRQELALTCALADASPHAVLYLIWRNPWMTVARDTYISRMLALVGWQTLPDLQGGSRGAARYPALQGNEAWLGQVQRVLLSSEPCNFTDADLAAAARLCPQATVQRVDGELLSWYGARAVPGLRYLREIAAAEWPDAEPSAPRRPQAPPREG